MRTQTLSPAVLIVALFGIKHIKSNIGLEHIFVHFFAVTVVVYVWNAGMTLDYYFLFRGKFFLNFNKDPKMSFSDSGIALNNFLFRGSN